MKIKLINIFLLVSLTFFSVSSSARTEQDERQELLELKNTITNLIDELVTEGILKEDKAELMKQTATVKAKVQAAQEAKQEQIDKEKQVEEDKKAVRVQYVPDHVKQEIRDQVRAELRQDVVSDVVAHAETKRWGVPDTMPEWVKKLKVSGDIRFRNQVDGYTDNNELDFNNDGRRDAMPEFLEVNEAQINLNNPAIALNEQRFFKERDRTQNRWRQRLRLAMSMEIANNLEVGGRVATGNINEPISLNQTLGNSGERFQVSLDHAYLKFTDLNADAFPWLKVWAGRFENPFFHTDLSFDPDLSFQGFNISLHHNLAGNNSLMDIEDDSKKIFISAGAFPLNEFEVSAQDQWLVGGQIGSSLRFDDQSKFKFALSYYDYVNIQGVRNIAQDMAGGDRITAQPNDFTAPQFLQGGNTLFDIRNDFDSLASTTPSETALYALAPDYNVINLTASYDWTVLAPVHVILTGDVLKNIGYDREDILERYQAGGNAVDAQIFQDQVLTDPDNELTEETFGYALRLTVGWPSIARKGNWQIFGAYKYLERDAVVDAYTDSNFIGGGTNGRGYILGGRYGVTDVTWVQGRWFSANTISGPDIGIDILQLDLSAEF